MRVSWLVKILNCTVCMLCMTFTDTSQSNKWAVSWEKTSFFICKNKTQISFMVIAKLISAFVFATQIVKSLYFLTRKFQASSHLLWLYSPVCVGPGRQPQRPVFLRRGSNLITYLLNSPPLCSSRSVSPLFREPVIIKHMKSLSFKLPLLIAATSIN